MNLTPRTTATAAGYYIKQTLAKYRLRQQTPELLKTIYEVTTPKKKETTTHRAPPTILQAIKSTIAPVNPLLGASPYMER